MSDLDVSAQLVAVVQTLVTVITGVIMVMLCSGTGIALISAGPVGVVGGVVIALAASLLGREFVKDAMMGLNVPPLLRNAFPELSVSSQRNQARIAQSICAALTSDADFRPDLTRQISDLIDGNLNDLLRSSEVQFVA